MSRDILNYGSWAGKWQSTRYPEQYKGTLRFTYSEATGRYPSVEVKFLGEYNNGQTRNYCAVVKDSGNFDPLRLNIFVNEIERDLQHFSGQLHMKEIANVFITLKCQQVYDDDGGCFCTIL